MNQESDVNSCIDSLTALANEGSDFNRFYREYTRLYNYYEAIKDAETMESIRFYMYGNKSAQDKSLEFSNLLTEVRSAFNSVHHIIYKNDFRYSFFEGWSDEEILDYIGPELSEAYYAKQKELNELISSYELLDDSSRTYYNDVEKIYIDFVKVGNEMALEAGYRNYLDMMYKEGYDRPYKYEETDHFYQYVIDYVVPFRSTLYDTVEREIDALTYSERQAAAALYEGNAFTDSSFDYIEEYVNYFGGDMKKAFDDLWYKNKYYYISYESKAMEAAFTTEVGDHQVVFFGNRYEPSTIVHEFGHYYAGTVVPNYTNGCFDLLETHSQGNEMLFNQYLSQKTKLSKKVTRLLSDLQILDSLNAIIVSTLVNEFEKCIYEDDNLLIGEADNYATRLINESGATFFTFSNYWRHVVVNSAAYYISYATSGIGALEIYMKAVDNLDNAKAIYDKLIHRDEEEENFINVYLSAGLISPLEEDAFKLIFNGAN